MIIKLIANTDGRTTKGIIQYNLKNNSELLRVENCFSTEINDVIDYIDSIEYQNKRIVNPAFHCCFSFPNNIEMEIELVNNMIDEYMEKMGYGEQPYCVFEHTDKSHHHFHIVSTRVSVNDYKKIPHAFEKRKSNALREKLIIKYELNILYRQNLGKEQFRKRDGAAIDISNKIKDVMREFTPKTIQELSEHLAQVDIGVQEGSKGVFFYYLHERRRAIGSSSLQVFEDASLRKQLNNNKLLAKNRLKKIVKEYIIHVNNGKDENLEKFMKPHNVSVKYSRNSGGVYGVSFEFERVSFKGSEIGLSINTIKNLLQAKKMSVNNVSHNKDMIESALMKIANSGGVGSRKHKNGEDEDEEVGIKAIIRHS